jgi:hypothetical protein
VEGHRQRAAGARTCRRHPAREEREIHRRARRQLASTRPTPQRSKGLLQSSPLLARPLSPPGLAARNRAVRRC